MANIVTLPNTSQEILQNYIREFGQGDQQGAMNEIAQQNADTNSSRFDFEKQKYGDDQTDKIAQTYKDRLASYYDAIQSEQDPAKKQQLMAQAKSEVDALPPEVKARLGAMAQEPVMTPQRQTALNSSSYAAGATGRTLAGGTDPNDYGLTLKTGPAQAFPTQQMFSQQQAKDLGTQDAAGNAPRLDQRNPSPSGNAVGDYEARQTGGLSSAAENLTAQTQKETEGMRLGAEAPLRAAQAQEAQAGTRQKDAATKGLEQTNGLMSGDSSLTRDIKTTSSGRAYADISGYSGATKNKLLMSYRANGIPAIDDKGSAEALREIDTARANLKAMLDQVEPLLPKDGATGRIISGPTNTIGRLLQTNGKAGAYQSWRAGAIQSLRAAAGAKGLRINQAEILMSASQDIPQLTDSYDTAKQRVENMDTLANNQEMSILGPQSAQEQQMLSNKRNGGGGGGSQIIKTSDGLSWRKNPDGSMTQVP